MNKYLTRLLSLLLFAIITSFVGFYLSPTNIEATCLGDIECSYTYTLTVCSNDNDQVCEYSIECEGGYCGVNRSFTDTIMQNCSGAGYECNSTQTCTAPYTMGADYCATSEPDDPTPPTYVPPPPSPTPTPIASQYYGCNSSNACATSSTYTTAQACSDAGLSDCQSGSCPVCEPDPEELVSGCYSSVACAWKQFSSLQECRDTDGIDDESCGTHSGNCPPGCQPTRDGNKFFYYFNDVNSNGSWDWPTTDEKRLVGPNWCTSGNTFAGVDQASIGISPDSLNLSSPNYTVQSWCGVGNGEVCSDTNETSCFNNSVEGQCHNQLGAACGIGLCGGDRDLKSGQIFMIRGQANWYTLNLTFPSGWRLSPGTVERLWTSSKYRYLESTAFGARVQVYVDSHNIVGQVCSGVDGFGLIRNYNKSCEIYANGQTGTVEISNEDTLILTGSGLSEAPTSEPSRLVMSKIDPNNNPNGTIPIDFSLPNTYYNESPSGLDYYIWNSGLAVPNYSFESGTTVGWSGNDVDNFVVTSNTKYAGTYSLVARKYNDGVGTFDPYVVSNIIQTGQSLAGRTFKLKFAMRSHANTVTVPNIALQAYPSWNYQSIGPITISPSWRYFEREVTFPTSISDTQLRVVLRQPDTSWIEQVYYDAIEVERSNTGYNCNTGYGNWCSDSVNLTNTLSEGTYKFFCDVPAANSANYYQKCTGNPFCTFNGGQLVCDGVQDCGSRDFVTVNVTCANQCGGSCGTADLGIPNVNLSITSDYGVPPDHDLTNDADRRLTLSWTDSPVGLADEYDIKILNRDYYNSLSGTAQERITNANCSDTRVLCLNGGRARSFLYNPNLTSYSATGYTVSGTAYGRDIYNQMVGAVRARNTTCGDQVGPWNIRNANIFGDIPTRVNTVNALNSCARVGDASFGTTAQGYRASNTVPNYTTTQNSSSASYALDNLPYLGSTWTSTKGTYNLDLNLINTDPANSYICADCSNGNNNRFSCTPQNGDDRTAPLAVGATPAQFYVVNENLANTPWWQWVNGVAYAGTGMTSNVSTTCAMRPDCSPYLAIRSTASNINAGIPLVGNSTIGRGSGSYSQRRSTSPAQVPGQYAMSQNFGGVARRDYNYYRTIFNVDEIPTAGRLSSTINSYTQITGAGSLNIEGADILYYAAGGTMTINAGPSANRWSVPADHKKIIMVNGNLTINGAVNQRIMTVEQGGYLAFIVSGTITFNNNVGHVVNEGSNPRNQDQSNVEGVFVGNSIVVATDGVATIQDNKFLGAGIFVGWNNIQLRRTFNDGEIGQRFHNNSPTELFFYRPDFLYNAPRAMQETNLLWQEEN